MEKKKKKKKIHKEFIPDLKTVSFPQSTERKGEIENIQAKTSKPLEGKIPLSVHPKFKCYLCEKSLPNKSDLINHQNLDHKGHQKKIDFDTIFFIFDRSFMNFKNRL